MITVTRTARGVRVEGAEKHEAISQELLDEVKSGKLEYITFEEGFLNITDDFGNVYVYQVAAMPVSKGTAFFYPMERQL